MDLKKRLQIKTKFYSKKLQTFYLNIKKYINEKIETAKNVDIKRNYNTFKRNLKIKIIKIKFYSKNFLPNFLFHKKISRWINIKSTNIKNYITINLMGYKKLGKFIAKVLIYGLIIFGVVGAIYEYSFKNYIASAAGYWLYETIILDDLPETIIHINNSSGDNNRK